MNYAFDASAIVAYLNGEPGDTLVEALLLSPDAVCYAHAVNLCEVFYGYLRISDEITARQVIADVDAAGIVPRRDMSQAFWFDVGRLKARGGISLADCFSIALARAISGTVVTSDHGEFDPLVPMGDCPIVFIR